MLNAFVLALTFHIGQTQEVPLQCLVSGKQVFAVASPRVVALGKIRLTKWSPSESTVAVSFAPVVETPTAEAARLKKGEVRRHDELGSLLLYTFESGKAVRVSTVWDTTQEYGERLGWIDENTLVIATHTRTPEANERSRFYIVDAPSGAIVKTVLSPLSIIGSNPCYAASKGDAAQVVMADLSSGQSNGRMSLCILSRSGLSDPVLTAGRFFGGTQSLDRTGIVWSIDDKPAACRWVDGKLQTSPVSEAELKAIEARDRRLEHDDEFRTGEVQLSISPLSPVGRKVSLKASHPVPLQPDEVVAGLALTANPSSGISIGTKGLLYELDGVIFARFLAELNGAAAERAMDQAEQAQLERWAKNVVSEYLSWTYGFEKPPDPTGFQVSQIGSFRDFASRIKWIGKNGRLFELTGERLVGTFDIKGAGTYSRLPQKG